MLFGELTYIDIILTVIDIILTFMAIGLGSWFISRKITNKNKLYGNQAKGDIAGGSIRKGKGSQSFDSGESISHNNKLKNNTTGGDIAGGDIDKDTG